MNSKNFLAKMKTAAIIAGYLTLAACGGDTTKETEKKVSEKVEEIKKVAEVSETPVKESSTEETKSVLKQEEQDLLGTHQMRLQWIDGKGTCEFGEADGMLTISGKYEKGGDFLSIDGKAQLPNAKELIVEGKIITKVSHLNGGKECVREGKYIFRSTKGRKYWRMQNMDNCEEGATVDYVDIYFKQ